MMIKEGNIGIGEIFCFLVKYSMREYRVVSWSIGELSEIDIRVCVDFKFLERFSIKGMWEICYIL